MKTAVFAAEGRIQLILTPENDFERSALKQMYPNRKGPYETGQQNVESENLEMYRGEFYACQGGWDREGPGEESLIVVRKQE